MSVAMHEQSNNTQPGVHQTVTPQGRLRIDGLSETDRNFAVGMHLSSFGALVLGPLAFAIPLVLWLVRKNESAFNDDHGRETVNFLITYIVASAITVWTIVIPIVLLILAAINMIRGALAASRGEYFRYPMTFRFLK